MSRDYKQYLDDMRDAIDKITIYLHGVTFEQFSSDTMRQEAVLFNLQILGEATKKLPTDITDSIPQPNGAKSPDYATSSHMPISASICRSCGMLSQTNFRTFTHRSPLS